MTNKNMKRISDTNDAAIERMLTPKIPRSSQHKTKRIHSVTLRRMVDELTDQPANAIGIRADAEVLIPLNEMHSQKCTELNEKRAHYQCECSSRDSLRQDITSGGLWGLDVNEPNDYLNQVGQEQLDELRHVLHVLGFAQRAIAAAFRNVTWRGAE